MREKTTSKALSTFHQTFFISSTSLLYLTQYQKIIEIQNNMLLWFIHEQFETERLSDFSFIELKVHRFFTCRGQQGQGRPFLSNQLHIVNITFSCRPCKLRNQSKKKISCHVFFFAFGTFLSTVFYKSFFLYFRSLHCGRITMHKNLFLSMSSNNIFWIIWYSCVLFQPDVWSTNPVNSLSVTNNSVDSRTAAASHASQNSNAHVARSGRLRTDPVICN